MSLFSFRSLDLAQAFSRNLSIPSEVPSYLSQAAGPYPNLSLLLAYEYP